MGIFDKPHDKPHTPRKPYKPADPEKKQKRLEERRAWQAFVKQLDNDPELEKHFAFTRMGIDVPQSLDPLDKKKAELKSSLIDEAVRLIRDDPELRRQYAENIIGEVIDVPKQRKRQDSTEIDYTTERSTISQALDELDSLAELREKLSDVGLGNESKKSFFDGITLKEILGAVQMLKGNISPQTEPQEPIYMVQLDGKPTQVTESQYLSLVKQGTIKLIGDGTPSTPSTPSAKPDVAIPTEPPAANEESISLPPLDTILEYIDLDTLESYVYNNNVVELLKEKLDEGSEIAQFIWGMLSNTTYDGIMILVSQYRGDDRASKIITELESADGKVWIESIISAVQEVNDGTG